jgi:predicted phosphodiesterase
MRIVHLSDVHFHPNQGYEFERFVLNPLLKDFKKQEMDSKIDFICFTGDLIDKGGVGLPINQAFEEFKNRFIIPLCNTLNLTYDRFIMVPGNHDIDRNRVNSYAEKGMRQELISIDSINYAMKNTDQLNLERIEAYKDFEKSVLSINSTYQSGPFGYGLILEVDNLIVGIGGINSSWRCYDNEDKNNLIVGKEQLEFIQNLFYKYKLDLSIALMHHPFDHLQEEDKENTKKLVLRDYDILFTGHTHRPTTFKESTSLGNGCILSTAPSNWTSNNYQGHKLFQNGYNIVDFDLKRQQITLHFRKYNYDKSCFVGDTDRGQGDSATSVFSLRNEEDKGRWEAHIDIVSRVKDNFCEDIDKVLVTYNTDTSAPKKLKNLFVLPKIVKTIYESSLDTETKDEEVYTFQELCETNENIVLFGPRETGKTTLLHRICEELIEGALTYQRTPVYIDVKGLKEQDPKKSISKFLGLSNAKLEQFLKTQDVVLLLDNIRFYDYNSIEFGRRHFLQLLEDLMDTYPNLVVIATSESLSEQDKPHDFLKHAISSRFHSGNINFFKTQEIQELMKKWFNIDGANINDENISTIVQSFRHLNIPSTPLAVSMFLWISEKQRNFKPINNAAMVQNFIERLFEKQSKVEVYSGEYDFTNKDYLLTQIALKMFELNNPNYRISATQLGEFIQEKYDNQRMTVKINNPNQSIHEWVLGYFQEKGVIISEIVDGNRYYKFKLNCFFQYYLSKNIIINEEFSKRVLSEEEYLMFDDEIDYFTGINRLRGDVLQNVVERMKKHFCDIFGFSEWNDDQIRLLLNEQLDFDKVFRTKSKSAPSISLDKIESSEDLNHMLAAAKQSNEGANDSLLDLANDLTTVSVIPNKIPQNSMSRTELLQRSWMLAARVWKNTEEAELGVYKDKAFENILICSLILLSLLKLDVDRNLDEAKIGNEKLASDQIEFMQFFSRFALAAHQGLFFSTMGTSKLAPVIQKYLDDNLKKSIITDVEKQMVLFFYTDLKGENYREYLNYAIQHQISASVRDFVFLKLTLLQVNTRNVEEEKYYKSKLDYMVLHHKKIGTRDSVPEKQRRLGNFESQKVKMGKIEKYKEKMNNIIHAKLDK